MIKQKSIEGQPKARDLWKEDAPTITMQQFAKDTANVEKILWMGESNSGKTKGYLDILGYFKAKNVPPEDIMMCIIFPDRSTGLTKLYNVIPKEYVTRVFPYTVNCYEDLVVTTGTAQRKLDEHFKKTGKYGWLVIELMEEAWRMTQDYYSRQAFGESLADYLALQREAVKEKMMKLGKEEKDTAYQALGGWQDWSIIKFFHNFNWIDKIKKMPFNVGATSEVKAERNKDSIFFSVGVCPAGEKDNVHRFDTVIYKSHKENKFYQQCFKWTGMSRLYSETDITDKNSWSMHKMIQKKFESKGYRSSAIEELEEEAGIIPPKKIDKVPDKIDLEPVPTTEQKTTLQQIPEAKKEPIKAPEPKPTPAPPVKPTESLKVETKEAVKEPVKPVATSQTISKTPEGEKTEQISKEEITEPLKKKEEKKVEPVDDFDWSV